MKESLKRIVLVLFGILLCCADKGINSTLLASWSDFPFSFLGILFGIAGIMFAFRKTGDK